jgi:hypothetical protein
LLPSILPLIQVVGQLAASFATALLPVLQPVFSLLGGLAGFLQQNAAAMQDLVLWVGISVAAFKVAGAVTLAYRGIMQAYAFATYAATAGEEGLTFAQYLQAAATRAVTGATKGLSKAFAANPIGFIIVAVVALVAGFKMLFERSQRFRNFIVSALPIIGKIFGAIFGGILHGIANIIRGFEIYARFYLGFADQILHLSEIAFGWIPGLGDKLTEARGHFQNFSKMVTSAIGGAAATVDTYAKKIDAGTQNLAKGLASQVDAYGKTTTKKAAEHGKNAGKAWQDSFSKGVNGTASKKSASRVKAPKTLVKAPRTVSSSGSQSFTVGGSGGGLSLSVTVNGSVIQEKDIARTIRDELIQFGRRVGKPVALGV